jgi:hypothetical protein
LSGWQRHVSKVAKSGRLSAARAQGGSMAAPEALLDVADSASFSFPAEVRPAAAQTLGRLLPQLLTRAPPQEERILAFWDEIKAFETQLKLTEGKPECVAAAAARPAAPPDSA